MFGVGIMLLWYETSPQPKSSETIMTIFGFSYGKIELEKKRKQKSVNLLDKKEIIRLLDDCLLSDYDLLSGKKHWSTFKDPFPIWSGDVS